jgi:hypothetical protein
MTRNHSGRANRVAPDGSLHPVADRGLFWGNRGQLLNQQGIPMRPFQGRNWIICQLEFHGRHRVQWQPRRLTELYFLDEPTALAAGHRPCAECRRGDYQLFKAAWLRAHSQQRIDAGELDRRLHADRVDNSRLRAHTAALDSLPDGCLIENDGALWLVRGTHLSAWTFHGYEIPTPRTAFPERVTVRTPRATVATLRAGYSPHEHPSAIST